MATANFSLFTIHIPLSIVSQHLPYQERDEVKLKGYGSWHMVVGQQFILHFGTTALQTFVEFPETGDGHIGVVTGMKQMDLRLGHPVFRNGFLCNHLQQPHVLWVLVVEEVKVEVAVKLGANHLRQFRNRDIALTPVLIVLQQLALEDMTEVEL